jgi:hypothetical protein
MTSFRWLNIPKVERSPGSRCRSPKTSSATAQRLECLHQSKSKLSAPTTTKKLTNFKEKDPNVGVRNYKQYRRQQQPCWRWWWYRGTFNSFISWSPPSFSRLPPLGPAKEPGPGTATTFISEMKSGITNTSTLPPSSNATTDRRTGRRCFFL